MTSRSPAPERPGAFRGPPGRAKTAQRGAKSGPRAAKTAQRAAQERLRSGPPGHRAKLPPKSSPEASRRPFRCPRGSIFDPPGADLADKTSYIFHETSYTCKDYDAESAAFREAVSLASRPFESTGPEAKKARKCKNRNPANKAIQTIAGPEAPG